MAITPNFTATQSLSDSSVTFTDTSTGEDAAIASRRVYNQLSNASYLVESGTSTDYESWSYSSSSKTLDIIRRSVGVSTTVQWLNSSNVVLYTKTIAFAFTVDDDLFIYSKIQDIAALPSILNDVNYINSLMAFTVNLVGSEKAIELASDTSASQSCLDRNFNLIANETKYF